jgi:hypothetical protein
VQEREKFIRTTISGALTFSLGMTVFSFFMLSEKLGKNVIIALPAVFIFFSLVVFFG